MTSLDSRDLQLSWFRRKTKHWTSASWALVVFAVVELTLLSWMIASTLSRSPR